MITIRIRISVPENGGKPVAEVEGLVVEAGTVSTYILTSSNDSITIVSK